ncbi:MAG: hypothetical protein RR806_08070 [Oscillospiraceae bacterium]
MLTGYSQSVFDSIMKELEEKEKLLNQYFDITQSIDGEQLLDSLETIINQRQELIVKATECDHKIVSISRKLFGNESQALIAILRYKVPENTVLPPMLSAIDKKCKIIYNILCNIKEADLELSSKVKFARESLSVQIEQVKNSKQIFGYNQNYQSANLGNVLDKKQ